jgi:hypothetical protein
MICELISSKMAKIEETEKDQGRYSTTLCTEMPLPLSGLSSYHDLGHGAPEIEYEHLVTCPHSPLRHDFVCSRSLGMLMPLFPFSSIHGSLGSLY